jgi:hypothetical protein
LITIVNHIRNPHFLLGRESPRHWEAQVKPRDCEVHRPHRGIGDQESPSLVLVPRTASPAFFWQTVRCKPDAYFRVEASVRCELVPAGPSPGFVLVLEHDTPESNEYVRLETPPVYDVPEVVAVRAYFHCPPDCSEVRIGVGVRNAVGMVEITEVRFIRILEPDELSHPHAILAPFVPGPPPVESVCICSIDPPDRPLRALLTLALGPAQVMSLPRDGIKDCIAAQAILLPDPQPPPALRSVKALFKLAEEKVVVISLPAFAALTKGALSIRRVEQPDDPIHAKVVFANDATRGFALHDCFAYAWPGKSPSNFVQNQFRRNQQFKDFCKSHHFEILLESSCDKDALSDRPVSLHRASLSGGLYVLDLNPLEAPASTMSEPTLAAHLLLSILRRSPSPAGQFAVPVREELQLREMIREAANRWDHFYVHDDDVPSEEITHQIVTVGREDEMFGLPIAPKPVILIRSGLRSGDSDSVYGVWAWFRQLLLHSRHPGSYAAPLSARFRLAWVPCTAPWEPRDGWSASHMEPFAPTEVEMEDSQIAALIDVRTGRPGNVRVIFAQPTPLFHRTNQWLPALARAFSARDFPAITCGMGGGPGSRRAFSWQMLRHELSVTAEPQAFEEPIYSEIIAQGGSAIRIELPAFEADCVANSIHAMHLAVTVLEQVIGLLYGLIAVNRTRDPVLLEGIGVIPPGETLLLDHEPTIIPVQAVRTG